MQIIKPTYFDRFRCICAACPDSCCQSWEVEVDPDSAQAYQALPGPLGEDLRRALRSNGSTYWLENHQGRCPMWRQDGLCRIQSELDEGALCQTCREFPRLRHEYGSFTEFGLELSCPEAARLILTTPWEMPLPTVDLRQPSGELDQEALESLLRSREQAFALLDKHPPRQALALLLVYGCHVQSLLDGGDPGEFQPEQALASARELAALSAPASLLPFFRQLEILTQRWINLLAQPQPGPWHSGYIALARYFVGRYWLQAVSDYDLYSRVKLAVISCLVVNTLGGDFLSTAQCYSKEIENDPDNLDALLDGAYRSPAFTDSVLLGLLLGTAD